VIEALRCNAEAANSELFVFIDGPRSSRERRATEELCALFDEDLGFKKLNVELSPRNRGLAESITRGVSSVLSVCDRVIVLEDDTLVSSHFLEYMNSGLDVYAEDSRVASIHGYVYPIDRQLPTTFFLRGADCWGWGTWARAWKHYNADGQQLLSELRKLGLMAEFDFGGYAGYSDMLVDQIEGRVDSWAIRWYASAFLADMLTLYPGESLVRNIGLDGSGMHCQITADFDSTMSDDRIQVSRIPIAESAASRRAFADFFREMNAQRRGSLGARLANRVRRVTKLR
jgi:hypothetical protein